MLEKVPVVETPVFVPYTKDSTLKKKLQEVDRMLGEATNSPTVRFVERCGGGTVIDLLGRSNPWAKEWQCPRTNCLPCKGRYLLSTEEDARKPGEGPPLPRPGKEETVAVPKCTGEIVG